MNFSIFRIQKNSGQSVQIIECKTLIVSIIENTADKIVTTGRDIFQTLIKSESRKACNEIHACGR